MASTNARHSEAMRADALALAAARDVAMTVRPPDAAEAKKSAPGTGIVLGSLEQASPSATRNGCQNTAEVAIAPPQCGYYPPDPLNPAAADAHDILPPAARIQRPPPLPVQLGAVSPPVQSGQREPNGSGEPLGLPCPAGALAADDADSQDDQRWFVAVKVAPPWLLSCIIHMVALILLGLITSRELRRDPPPELTIGKADASFDALLEPVVPADMSLKPAEPVVSQSLPVVEDPGSAPWLDQLKTPDLGQGLTLKAPAIGILLTGRDAGMRQTLLNAYGGTGKTESAVQAGLGWLARQQHKSGSWSLVGPYADGGGEENNAAAAGMALLAFQGAGYTPGSGSDPKFREVVAKGWKSLLARQSADGSFYRFAKKSRDNQGFYTHAISTLALCELYAMTHDPQYKEPAQRAVDFLVKAQSKQGGWKYQPNQRADLSVSGWVMMALQSARMAELNVPQATLYEFEKFLDSVAQDGGRQYRYEPRRAASPAMSAEGLLCRQYLGWEANDPRLVEGAKLLTARPINFKSDQDVYYWYYATQVLHHLGGPPWEEWNKVMAVELPGHQVRNGKEAGSWNPMDDAWGSRAGRLYTTCLSIYMLEVYYRHLPIYSQPLNLRVGPADSQ